jgi:hypothetical protein
MTGFGCPEMVSTEVAESTIDFITTVVSDNDCVPGLSLATVVNALLDAIHVNLITRRTPVEICKI